MGEARGFFFLAAASAALLTFAPFSVQGAAEGTGGEPQTLVRWEVELSGGVRARLTAKLGEMVQVTRPDGTTVGMVPRSWDQKSGIVSFEVFAVFGDPNREKQKFQPLDRIEAKKGLVVLAPKIPDLTLKLVAVERVEPRPSPPAPPKKEGSRLIKWSLRQPDGRVAQLIALEGDLTRIRLADGRSFGLRPAVEDSGRVSFQLVAITEEKSGGGRENLEPVERFSLEPGGGYFPTAFPDTLITVTGFRETEELDWRDVTPRHLSAQSKAACCVTCDGFRACACAVSMECGDCCVPPCCLWSN